MVPAKTARTTRYTRTVMKCAVSAVNDVRTASISMMARNHRCSARRVSCPARYAPTSSAAPEAVQVEKSDNVWASAAGGCIRPICAAMVPTPKKAQATPVI